MARNSKEVSAAAQRYAQAAFELALEANALAAVEEDLKRMAGAFAESAELERAAASPLIEVEDKARAIGAIAERLGLSELGRKVVGAAALNGRAAELPGVATAFSSLAARHKGAREVEIISAQPLSDADLRAITTGVSRALGADVQPSVRVDADLIGGFVVRAGSRQYDASLKAKLAGLKQALLTG